MNEISDFCAESHLFAWHIEVFKHFGKERLKYAFAATLLELVMSFHFCSAQDNFIVIKLSLELAGTKFLRKFSGNIKIPNFNTERKIERSKALD